MTTRGIDAMRLVLCGEKDLEDVLLGHHKNLGHHPCALPISNATRFPNHLSDAGKAFGDVVIRVKERISNFRHVMPLARGLQIYGSPFPERCEVIAES